MLLKAIDFIETYKPFEKDPWGAFWYLYTILPKVLGRPLLMNTFDYFSNFYEYKS